MVVYAQLGAINIEGSIPPTLGSTGTTRYLLADSFWEIIDTLARQHV